MRDIYTENEVEKRTESKDFFLIRKLTTVEKTIILVY